MFRRLSQLSPDQVKHSHARPLPLSDPITRVSIDSGMSMQSAQAARSVACQVCNLLADGVKRITLAQTVACLWTKQLDQEAHLMTKQSCSDVHGDMLGMRSTAIHIMKQMHVVQSKSKSGRANLPRRRRCLCGDDAETKMRGVKGSSAGWVTASAQMLDS